MTENDELIKKRLAELAQRAGERGVYTCSWFLSLPELSLLSSMRRELSYVPYTLFGGMEGCERQMAQFGSPELCGYEQPFPICCLCIRPLSDKFADALTHRDFLGALMNLGVERSTLGDIIVRENAAYLFCTEAIAPFVSENLTQVKHTAVSCKVADELPQDAAPRLSNEIIQTASCRVDGVIAKVYKLSRSDSEELFIKQRVFINGALCQRAGEALKENDVVSVRGMGRFIFRGAVGISKKGKLRISLDKYEG